MTDTAQQQAAARLANGAYDGSEVPGYTIDRELSNRNRTVYVTPENKAIIAFSGTRPNSKRDALKDLGTDALLAFGLENISSRFRKAKKVTKKTMEKYGNDNVETVGHSLGSSQGLYVNAKYGVPHTGFAPGVSVKNARDGILDKISTKLFFKGRRANKNATVYHAGGDPISALAPTLNHARVVKVAKKPKESAHSIRNFL
jgi:hypothetical protein